MAGIGQDLKKIYSDETRIVENASLCTIQTPPGIPGVSREAKLSTEFEFGSLVR